MAFQSIKLTYHAIVWTFYCVGYKVIGSKDWALFSLLKFYWNIHTHVSKLIWLRVFFVNIICIEKLLLIFATQFVFYLFIFWWWWGGGTTNSSLGQIKAAVNIYYLCVAAALLNVKSRNQNLPEPHLLI